MRIRKGVRVEYLSSAWMFIEALGSIGFGLVAGSFALLAFGGDSLIELLSGFAVLRQLSGKAVGSETRGGRTEQVAGALLFALVPVIGLGAFYSYVLGLRPEGSPQGTVIAMGAIVIMPYLYFQKKKIGEETRILSLRMDAIESVTCFFMSVTLLGGLLAELFLGLWLVDYLATAVILAFVAKEAIESYHELHEEE